MSDLLLQSLLNHSTPYHMNAERMVVGPINKTVLEPPQAAFDTYVYFNHQNGFEFKHSELFPQGYYNPFTVESFISISNKGEVHIVHEIQVDYKGYFHDNYWPDNYLVSSDTYKALIVPCEFTYTSILETLKTSVLSLWGCLIEMWNSLEDPRDWNEVQLAWQNTIKSLGLIHENDLVQFYLDTETYRECEGY